MGLSSLFNPDILIGMGQAHQSRQKSILDDEAARRKQGTSLFTSIFEHPDLTPEGRDEALRQISEASMAKPDKPYKFDINRVLSVRPEIGKSVAPGQTMNAQLPQSGGMPSIDISQEFPAPDAPADARRSGFYSPQERQKQAEDVYRRQQQIGTEEQIKRTRATQQAEQEFAPLAAPKPPEDFT